MALAASEIVVAGTGGVWTAPEGTAMPASVDVTLNAAFVNLGYTSEDGVTFTVSRETEELMAWQSTEAVRIMQTGEPKTIAFELLQFSPDTVPVALGGGVITDAVTGDGIIYTPPSALPEALAMVVEAVDGDVTYRWLFPRVQLQGDTEWNLRRTDAARLPLEFKVLASTPGWTMQTDDPAWIAAL